MLNRVAALALAVPVLAVQIVGTGPAAAAAACQGRPATIEAADQRSVRGTPGDDVVVVRNVVRVSTGDGYGPGRDVVRIGKGGGVVYSGVRGATNPDVIDLGRTQGTVFLRGRPSGQLAGGGERFATLVVRRPKSCRLAVRLAHWRDDDGR